MTKYKWNFEQVFYSVLAFAVTVAFCHLALACYYADSEIWLLTVSQQTFNNAPLSSLYYKWSFHALTYVFSHFAPTELAVYQYARTGWMIIAILTQIIISYSFSVIMGQKKLLLPIFIAIMTFSAFFNQGFRIRGDILSLFSHAIIFLTLFQLKERQMRWFYYFWLFFWNTVLLLSTPKSIYFYLAQFVFGVSLFKSTRASYSFFKFVWLSHLVPLLAIVTIALMSHFLKWQRDLVWSVQALLDFYIKSFDSSLVNPKLFSIFDFANIIKAGAQSPAHTLVFCIGVLFYFYSSFLQKKNTAISALNIYFGTLFLCFILHNQKYSFFIGTYGTPLIAYTFAACALYMSERFRQKSKYVLSVLLVVFVGVCYLNYRANLYKNNNYAQSEAIDTFDKYITKNPHLTFYDIIGILPRKTKIFLFVGPGEITKKSQIVLEIKKQDPDIILFTNKFQLLEPDIQDFLTQTRLPLENNVWVKGDYFSITKNMDFFRKSVLLKGKEYWVIPHAPKKYIFNLSSQENLKEQVLYLKNGQETKELEHADSFAVPVTNYDIIQTNVERIGFAKSLFWLFAYDTHF